MKLDTLSGEINRLLDLIETENIYQAQERRDSPGRAEHDAQPIPPALPNISNGPPNIEA